MWIETETIYDSATIWVELPPELILMARTYGAGLWTAAFELRQIHFTYGNVDKGCACVARKGRGRYPVGFV